jgi:APA family basic amino acid/polyamine antiporter
LSGCRTPLAVGFIVFFTALSCMSVRFGGRVQSFVTSLKIVIIIGLTLAIFVFSRAGSWGHFLPHAAGGAWPGFAAFGTAVLAALWAYDGWNNMSMVAGEIQNPQRSIPLSLIIGVGGVMLIYTLVNIAYVYALPFDELLSANSKLHPDGLPAATKAASSFLGTSGTVFISAAFFISAMGALNGSILTSSRIPYAMATENMMPRFLAAVHPRTHVPVRSVIIQGGWAAVLAVSGTFDQLTDYVVFAGWVFYALAAISLIIFRFRMPDAPRGYRVPAYPWLPLAFAGVAVALLINTLMTAPRESLTGLLFIASGVPVFFLMRRRGKVAATDPA